MPENGFSTLPGQSSSLFAVTAILFRRQFFQYLHSVIKILNLYIRKLAFIRLFCVARIDRNLADKREDLYSSGLWGLRLLFSTESGRECVEVAKGHLGLSEYRPNVLTRGLYYRGVE